MLICISYAISICATTAKAKHTHMCDNLISAHQNSARGKQRTQLALLKYSHFFLALLYITHQTTHLHEARVKVNAAVVSMKHGSLYVLTLYLLSSALIPLCIFLLKELHNLIYHDVQ